MLPWKSLHAVQPKLRCSVDEAQSLPPFSHKEKTPDLTREIQNPPSAEKFWQSKFLTKGHAMSAGLVRTLLICAGIEQNPGPTPGTKFSCNVCQKALSHNSSCVQCCQCKNWIHFRKVNNCSNLKSINQYTPTYPCQACTNSHSHPPSAVPASPSQSLCSKSYT